MAIRKTKLVVLASFLLLLSVLLIFSGSTNAQKRKAGGASKVAQPTAQFKTCSVCNGSGKTHEHVAKYEEARCYNCAGKGETLCDSNFGWPHSDEYYRDGKRMVCSKCRGNGRIRCPECHGSGVRSVDRGYDVTKVCHNCKGSGRVQLTREEIRVKEEAKLEAERERAREELRAKEEARLAAERAERAERERVRLETERRRLIAATNSLAPSLKNSIGMELILIKPGEFRMGENNVDSDDRFLRPVHEVSINLPFYFGKFEVTQAQWHAVMGNNPSHIKGDNLPVDSVSFNDAKEFCKKLSQMTGEEYRLPTEAEWEYTCRAGKTDAYAGDLDAMAWFDGNSGNKMHPVGQKQPNHFGLFDMHGNVWEWCEDVWHDNYSGQPPTDGSAWLTGGVQGRRVLRGGSWYYNSRSARSANRDNNNSDVRGFDYGIRVVMSAKVP